MSPPGDMPDYDALLASATGPTKPRDSGPPASDAPEPSRWFALALFGLALLCGAEAIRTHWVPNKWLFGDGAFYMNVARGILENFSLRQESLHPHSWYDRDLGWNYSVDAAWSNIAIGRNGEWWPKHPILMPIASTPFLWAFGPIGTLVFQLLFFCLIPVFAYRVASHVASRPAAVVAAAALVATPWIYDRAWGFNNDVFYSVLILAALDAALGEKAILAGALLGIGVFAKATNVLYGPGLLAIFLLRKDWRGALRFCIAAAIPAALYLGLNAYMYGSPFKTGYDRILVREAGKLGTHSHATDFHWSNLPSGLRSVLLGSEGFLGKFPLFFAALLGLPLVLMRKWREALVLAWCIAVPIVFHAPYTWYRLEFNLPQIAMAVAPLAALLPPFALPGDVEGPRSRVRWGRIGLAGAVVLLLLAGGVRHAIGAPGRLFYRELPHAAVFLGDVPCDYYNNQMERWECSHLDNHDLHMTGRVLGHELKVDGKDQRLLLLHPHPSGKQRRIEYDHVAMTTKLELVYALADSSKPDAEVNLVVTVDGQPVLEESVKGKGLQRKEVDTSAFAGKYAKVAVGVSSPSPDWAIFLFDGGPI